MKILNNQIILGDALEELKKLPDGCVDAVITDPPYSSGGRTAGERQQATSNKYESSSNKFIKRDNFIGDNKDQRSWMHWCALWISECQRILKNSGYFLMFTDWRQLPAATDALQFGDITWRGTIVWDKGGGSRAPHKGYFRHQCEYVVWGTKEKCHKAEHAGPFPGCYHFPVLQKDKFHLAGKPTALLEELVQVVPYNSLILDPFAGSGTLAVAAMRQNRNYLCIEKMQSNVDIIYNRLVAEQG